MINQDIIAQDLFYKIRGRFPSMEMGDEQSMPTYEAAKGRFFDFDAIFDDVNLGKVSINIKEPGRLKIYFNRNILENANDIVGKEWFKFLKEMRKFAMKRLMSLDARDISKTLDKKDFGYLANEGKIMSESAMFGTTRTSYKPLDKTKLIIIHSEPVDESIPGARSRHIKSLFVQNKEGERFKYPFIHKLGAECMLRHVANGGVPYDDVGNSIVEMSKNIAQLASFKRYVGNHDLMNSDTNHIVGRANEKLQNLKETMRRMTKQHHYEAYKESFKPTLSPTDGSSAIDEVTMEDYKNKFTVKSFQENIADVFPLLHNIMQETELNLEDLVSEEVASELEENMYVSPDDQFNEWADDVIADGYAASLDEAGESPVVKHVSGNQFHVTADGQEYTVTADTQRDGNEYDDPVNWVDAVITDAAGQTVDNPALEDEIVEILSNQFADVAMEVQSDSDVDAGDAAYDAYKDSQYEGHDMPELNDIRKMAGLKQQEKETNEGPEGMEQSQEERKAANEYMMSVARAIRSGEVDPAEVEQEFFNTLPMMGISDEKTYAAWDRITGNSKPTARPAMSDAEVDAEMKGLKGASEEDDDAAFLNNLRSKAKSGSIKSDDTGFGSEVEGAEDIEQDSKDRIVEKANPKEVAEFILGFYDRENKTFPLGETGVQVKVEKKFGEQAGHLAQQLIQKLSGGHKMEREERDTFESIRRLSGLPTLQEAKKSPKAKKDYDKDGEVESEKDEVIGSRRKAAGLDEGKVKELDQDLKDKKMSDDDFKKKYKSTKDEVRKDMKKKVSESHLDDILKLSGLIK